MSNYKFLNHTRKRLLFAQGQLQETSIAQSHLKETSMLKENSKRLPLLNHNWKRLILTITKNWIRFWILDIQSEVFTIQYKQNRLCFSRHLRILRSEQLKEFSKLLMCFRRFAQRVLALYMFLSLFCLQVFIPIYRGFERRWELAVTSTCLAWSFDFSPLILCLIW